MHNYFEQTTTVLASRTKTETQPEKGSNEQFGFAWMTSFSYYASFWYSWENNQTLQPAIEHIDFELLKICILNFC